MPDVNTTQYTGHTGMKYKMSTRNVKMDTAKGKQSVSTINCERNSPWSSKTTLTTATTVNQT